MKRTRTRGITVAEFLLGNLAWWAIAAGNLPAAFFMGGSSCSVIRSFGS